MKAKFFLFIFLLFLLACNKDKLEIFFPGSQEHGFMTASKKVDGSSDEWAASGFAIRDAYHADLLNFRGDTEDEYGQRRESLNIRQIPMKSGKYKIQEGSPSSSGSPESGYYRVISDGDVTGANYGTRGKNGNWVEIIEIDTVAKVVKGKFSVHYIISDKHKDSGFPKEVDFEDGYFEVEIIR